MPTCWPHEPVITLPGEEQLRDWKSCFPVSHRVCQLKTSMFLRALKLCVPVDLETRNASCTRPAAFSSMILKSRLGLQGEVLALSDLSEATISFVRIPG